MWCGATRTKLRQFKWTLTLFALPSTCAKTWSPKGYAAYKKCNNGSKLMKYVRCTPWLFRTLWLETFLLPQFPTQVVFTTFRWSEFPAETQPSATRWQIFYIYCVPKLTFILYQTFRIFTCRFCALFLLTLIKPTCGSNCWNTYPTSESFSFIAQTLMAGPCWAGSKQRRSL